MKWMSFWIETKDLKIKSKSRGFSPTQKPNIKKNNNNNPKIPNLFCLSILLKFWREIDLHPL